MNKKDKNVLKSQELYGQAPIWKAIVSLAVPSVITILVMIIYNMADMYFIGKLNDSSRLAAISVVGPVFSLVSAFATMIGTGGCSVMARFIGAMKIEKAKSIASKSFYFSVIIGLMTTAVMLIFTDPLLFLLGANEDMLEYARSYMRILATGASFMIVSMSLGSIIRADGAIVFGLFGNLVGTITNIVLDPIFILLFKLDVQGAAIATIIGNSISSFIYLYYVLRRAKTLSIHPRYLREGWQDLLDVILVGLPNGISSILSGFASSFSNNLLVLYGTISVAAMGAAGKVAMIIGMLQMGIVMGCQPLMAYNYGAKDEKRLAEIVRKLTYLTIGVGMFAMGCCLWGKSSLIGMFLSEKAAAVQGESFVTYLVMSSPFLGIFYIGINYLQAADRAIVATVLSVARQGLLLIPCLYLGNRIFGISGIALAHPIADLLSTILAVLALTILVVKNKEYKNYGKKSSSTDYVGEHM